MQTLDELLEKGTYDRGYDKGREDGVAKGVAVSLDDVFATP